MSKKYLIISIASLILIVGGSGLWWSIDQNSEPEEALPVVKIIPQILETGSEMSGEILSNSGVSPTSLNLLKKEDSPDGKKRFELYSDKESCDCYSRAQCSISIIDTTSNTEIERLNSIQQGPCPIFPTGGTPIKWYDDESFIVSNGFGDSGASGNEFSVYNLTKKKITKNLWKQSVSNFQNPPIVMITFGDKSYYFQSNKDTVTLYEVISKDAIFTISDKKDPERYILDYTKLIKKATISASGELSIIPDYTGIHFKIGDKSYQYNIETSKITFKESMKIPTEANPIITGDGFLKTKLYVKNNLLYSFIVNDEEKMISKWNDDFKILDKKGYFTMWGNLYFSSMADLGPVGEVKPDSKIIAYECINGLDLDGSFYVNGKKQEIRFIGEKKCIDSELKNAIYDNSGIYILGIPSNGELKYFPGLDGKSIKKISEDEIGDTRGNILVSKCGHAGCEYTKK